MKNYWLVKSEPDCYSIDQFKKDGKTQWTGVRNYQARNYMRAMEVGDEVLFYHSGAGDETGIVGIGKVSKKAYPDLTALDKKDDHYDPKATKTNPIWDGVEISYQKTLPKLLTLKLLKQQKSLAGMELLKTGSRLSVQPVSIQHFNEIVKGTFAK